jgi:ribosomal-protein-alanine N-acetyltransferase
MTDRVHDPDSAPEFRPIGPQDADSLACLYSRFQSQGIEEFFHPHPFTHEEAVKRANYVGKDFYCLMRLHDEAMGYGLLRGWDEGFEIPSLGCAIDLAVRGHGYARLLMEYLHATATQRGAKRIRLKVYPNNTRAIGLYRSMGYVLQGGEAGQWIGYLDLPPPANPLRRDAV